MYAENIYAEIVYSEIRKLVLNICREGFSHAEGGGGVIFSSFNRGHLFLAMLKGVQKVSTPLKWGGGGGALSVLLCQKGGKGANNSDLQISHFVSYLPLNQ